MSSDAATARVTWRDRLSRFEYKASPYLYISPFFIVFSVTGLFPLVYTAWVSVHKWHLIGGDKGFNGVENYAAVLDHSVFWIALRNTFSIFLLSSVPQIIAAIFIAWVLDANLRARTFWRMGVLLPYVVAPVAVALIFSKVFADQSGMINTLLGMRIDIARRRPVIANTMGGFSGAAVFPVALRMVYQVARACRIPVMGCGGVTTARDVIEMMMAGASAVQVGAANLVNPYASKEIVEALPAEMQRLGIGRLSDIIGIVE